MRGSEQFDPEEVHPSERQLERFLRGELPRSEVCAIVRHLLARCPRCAAVTRRLWPLGNSPLRALAAVPQEARASGPSGRDEPEGI